MSHLLRTLSWATVLFGLISCADVTCKQPIGSQPTKLDPEKWNGTWSTTDGHTICARVKDADKGVLEVAWLDIKDDAIKLEKMDVTIRSAAGWLWASYKEEKDKSYTIARISDPEDHLLAWTLQSAPLKNAVKSGQLKGEVLKDEEGKETKSIVLDQLTDEQLQAIRDGKYGEVFNWGKPALVLHHLKD